MRISIEGKGIEDFKVLCGWCEEPLENKINGDELIISSACKKCRTNDILLQQKLSEVPYDTFEIFHNNKMMRIPMPMNAYNRKNSLNMGKYMIQVFKDLRN